MIRTSRSLFGDLDVQVDLELRERLLDLTVTDHTGYGIRDTGYGIRVRIRDTGYGMRAGLTEFDDVTNFESQLLR